MIKAGLIGCGRIGYIFDRENKTKNNLSHFSALRKNNKIKLEAISDKQESIRNEISTKYNIKAYENYIDLVKNHTLDLIVIATPDETHYKIALNVLKFNPKLVFIEKPIGCNFSEVKKIVDLYSKEQVKIMVNYSRRFFNPFQKWGRMIKDSELIINNIFIKHTGTLIHNGIHFLDLVIFFFGKPQKIHLFSNPGNSNNIFQLIYPNFNAKVLFIGLDKLNTSIEEIDILHDKGRFKVNNRGMSSFEIVNDPEYSGFKIFGNKTKIDNHSGMALKNAYDNITEVFDSKASLVSPASDSILLHDIIKYINEKNLCLS